MQAVQELKYIRIEHKAAEAENLGNEEFERFIKGKSYIKTAVVTKHTIEQ